MNIMPVVAAARHDLGHIQQAAVGARRWFDMAARKLDGAVGQLPASDPRISGARSVLAQAALELEQIIAGTKYPYVGFAPHLEVSTAALEGARQLRSLTQLIPTKGTTSPELVRELLAKGQAQTPSLAELASREGELLGHAVRVVTRPRSGAPSELDPRAVGEARNLEQHVVSRARPNIERLDAIEADVLALQPASDGTVSYDEFIRSGARDLAQAALADLDRLATSTSWPAGSATAPLVASAVAGFRALATTPPDSSTRVPVQDKLAQVRHIKPQLDAAKAAAVSEQALLTKLIDYGRS